MGILNKHSMPIIVVTEEVYKRKFKPKPSIWKRFIMWLKKMFVLLVIVVAVSCSRGINDGKVVAKWYEQPYSYPVTTCVMAGKVMIPITNICHQPGRYKITIEKNLKKADINMDKNDWDSVVIGQNISFKP